MLSLAGMIVTNDNDAAKRPLVSEAWIESSFNYGFLNCGLFSRAVKQDAATRFEIRSSIPYVLKSSSQLSL